MQIIFLKTILKPLECDESCEICSKTPTTCSKCRSNYYPSELLNSNCIKCDQIGQLLDPITKICKVCNVENCKKCLDLISCQTCLDGYYLVSTESIKVCQKKITLIASLTPLLSPKVFLLEYSDVWPAFFSNITKTTQFSIESFSSNDFSTSIEAVSERSFLLVITFLKTVIDKTSLTISFSPKEDGDENLMYMLEKKTMEIKLDEFHPCPENKTWNKGFF